MTRLLNVSRELITIINDLRYRIAGVNFDEGNLIDFDQLWASTALGFGGIGGSALTTARTYVFIPEAYDVAYVYFGDRFAYAVDPENELFLKDLNNKCLASVEESVRYEA